MEPLFILSFRHRAELFRLAETAGWQPVAAQRTDDGARFAASAAAVAVIDARGALEDGKEAVRRMAETVEANAAALLVLLSRNDAPALETMFQLGATHFLVSPFSDQQWLQALNFARRHAERAGSGGRRRRSGEGETQTISRSSGTDRDPLTGLPDARAARDWLDAHLDRQGDAGPVAALSLSVSRYDAINAAFGRPVGNRVLEAAARRIERLAEPDGEQVLVARMAGAEFAVLLAPPARLEDAQRMGEELIEAIGRPFLSGDHVVTLASRAGVALSQPGDDAAALLRRVSVALAEAKAPASAPLRVIAPGAESATSRGERLEVDLRRALDRGEIEIRFQPQVAVESGEIVGVEALARWNHPSYGELEASTLFDVAGRSDYLAQLSDHVQRRAIALAASWPAALSRLRLSVNITAADLLRPGFDAQFLAMVAASGFPAGRLTVEVTESGLIEDLAGASETLGRLRAGALKIAIDDFGTGYSSLAYLKALPIDYLKLDRRLSHDLAGSTRDRIVVRSVIDMARSLGLGVIAEGVETEQQLALLAEQGCTLYQGFLCAPPLDPETFVARVTGQQAPASAENLRQSA
ncbi:MAG: putative bifunctional diguanylate cyclase/phosphodiesterase [Sphingosinicella sp.]